AVKLKPTTVTVSLMAPRPTESGSAAIPYGPWLTFRQFVHVAAGAPGMLTMTLRLPVAAEVVTETGTTSCVGVMVVGAPAVTPDPEKLTVLPGAKPVPVMVIGKEMAPRPTELGITPVAVGLATEKVCVTCVAASQIALPA